MPTGLDYVTESLQELGVVGAVDPPSPEDAALGLNKLNRIFDNWNADKKGVYAWNFAPFTLTPNLSPHTIGPTGATFAATVRPSKIYGASLVLNNVTPNVNVPIRVVDEQWWLDQDVPDLATTMPTDLYYSPTWPNGSLYFWPVPTVAYGVELLIPIVLAEVTLASAMSLPPGYHDALVLTLAEDLAAPMKIDLSPVTAAKARRARARIFDANDPTVRLATRDAGMPSVGETSTRTNFNYHNRSWS